MRRTAVFVILVTSTTVLGCASHKAGGPGTPAVAAVDSSNANQLTDAEKAAGWQLLFDGVSTKGWRGYKKPTFPERGWHAVDGTLKHDKNEPGYKPGDIITEEQFDNFELVLEFKLTPRGNSGIKYLVDEALVPTSNSAHAFEFQILDDDLHPDATKGKDGNRKCGGLYDLIAPPADKSVRPIGEWNQARLLVDGPNTEHWLNGKKTVSYVRSSAEMKSLIGASKFKEIAGFGEGNKGHILLQDHNDEIAFRNIKIRRLPAKLSAN